MAVLLAATTFAACTKVQTEPVPVPTSETMISATEAAVPTDTLAVPTSTSAEKPEDTPTPLPTEEPSVTPAEIPALTRTPENKHIEQAFRFNDSVITLETLWDSRKDDFYLVAYDAEGENELKVLYFESYFL